ncbi:MAG: 50S ribosomal protein L32 [Candidatus Hydrogenedentota bacterium]|nr:MAG: 50S ribosomal protein L32 [Candidatus Hydrogenedentota bacterium]
MALPKRRHSRTRSRKRRNAKALTLPTTVRCRECGEPILPHTACPACGAFYGERQVIRFKREKEEKKESAAPASA